MAKVTKSYTDAERQAGIDVPVTPEQQAIIDKMVADAADMARASKVHDRAQAIKDALTAKAIAQAIKDALAAQATALAQAKPRLTANDVAEAMYPPDYS